MDMLNILQKRFETHMHRHPKMRFDEVKSLLDTPQLTVIKQMEETGGEPDVVFYEGHYYMVDMSAESPKDRRSICYDKTSRIERKKFPPETSAWEMADTMGIKLLDEAFYRYIQTLEPLDLKTSSWLDTPKDVRSKDGAIFGDRRYDRVFVYHNGADSYYGARGFRGYLLIK